MITRTIAPHLDGRRHETAIDRIDDPFAPVGRFAVPIEVVDATTSVSWAAAVPARKQSAAISGRRKCAMGVLLAGRLALQTIAGGQKSVAPARVPAPGHRPER